MKPYIKLSKKLRTSAKNEIEKDLFRLMNIRAFGKTVEKIRNYK